MQDSTRPLGRGPAFRAALERAEQAARTSVPVLIGGESGTGKEVVARHVHALSARRRGPFVAVNVAAIPWSLLESELFGHERGAFSGADRSRAGLFQEARGGTLLVDEIGDLPLQLQVKLLRVLQEGEVRPVGRDRAVRVDVRVIAATHCRLQELVAEGRFREDLYYRVAVFTVELPALRERGDDVILLARHLLARHADPGDEGGRELTQDAIEALRRHSWPGNVRELENACRHALVVCPPGEMLRAEHWPEAVRAPPPPAAPPLAFTLSAARESVERTTILGALAATAGNRTQAARRLGLSRQSLHVRLRRYGIGPGAGRPDSDGGEEELAGGLMELERP